MLTLRSPRLLLRKLTAADATPEYAAWLNDPAVNRFLEVRHVTHTVESCSAFIEQMNASADQHLFGIFLADCGRHIGNIKLGFVDRRNGTGQISLLLGDKSVWGQGYATEAIRSMTSHAFTGVDLQRVEAGVYESNLGSLRAFMKVGYTVEGFFRQKFLLEGRRVGCFWLGVLRNEWQHE